MNNETGTIETPLILIFILTGSNFSAFKKLY